MKHFTAIYQMPPEALAQWMSKPETERAEAEEKMRTDWDTWMEAHAGSVLNTIGLGKAKHVSAEGITDTANGMMLSSYVQAESAEAAAEIFKDHPHLAITGASIDVMETNPMTPQASA